MRHRPINSLSWITTCAAASLLTAAGAADAGQFFRITSAADTVITRLDEQGFIHWSNAVPTGAFLIERCQDLSTARWTPFTRGYVSNYLSAVKICDFATPEGMAFIPGGWFTMGDILGDHTVSTPVHTVGLSPFFMQTHEVSNSEMQEALQWAYTQGLIQVDGTVVKLTEGATNGLLGLQLYASEISFTNGTFAVKAGKQDNPCIYVSWYGAAAYCNFRSLMESKRPCYDMTNWTCNFNQTGYRLPTESEWEFAARGGYEGMRFPWADTNVITHSRANYKSTTNNWYDVSPTLGFHPDYASQPLRTSPVGVFAPNDFGLYDMSGNVWEWCWDWGTRYSADTQFDPTGPESGTLKVFRGGSNYTSAERVTCAFRYQSSPAGFGYDTGFRTVLRPNP